jgi:glucose-1-phosphate adenylyltransferase
MQDVLTLILGGGRGPGLYPLTKHRSKAAVPLAGKYRLIDIPISNCLNSGLNRIYVLTQFLSVSLHRHIGNTYKFDPFSRAFVEVLAAQVTNEGATWYQGSADAVRQNIRYVQDDPARDLLILSDDQLFRFDFRQLLRAHRESRADVTLAVVPVSRAEASTLGVVQLDEGGRVSAFVEKPQVGHQLDALRLPAGWLERRGVSPEPRGVSPPVQLAAGRDYLGNMGIYLFTRQALCDLLSASPEEHDFARDVFPRVLGTHHCRAYLFNGPWEHLETIQAYHEANLALAGREPPFDFHGPEGVIYTRMRNLPASRLSAARLDDCLVSDGCTVAAGTRMSRCVVGVRSLIGRDVALRDAVLLGANFYETGAQKAENRRRGLPDLGVGDHSVLERVILDKNCRIGRNVRLVNRRGLREDNGDHYVIRDGIIVIPNDAVVPDGTVI